MAALLALGGLVGGWSGASALLAQDDSSSRRMPENITPEQMRQKMLERVRERFGVKDDAEWQAISQRITQVLEARRALGGGGGGPGGFGGPPGSGPGGPGGPGGDSQRRDSGNSASAGGGDGNAGPGGPGGPPPDGAGGPGGPGNSNRQSDPEMEALRKAIDANAPVAELKTKMEQVRTARAQKEATLEKAQTELRQILTTRQEAVAVSMGWLK